MTRERAATSWVWFAAIIAASSGAACSSSSPHPSQDAAVPDSSAVDAQEPDAAEPDATDAGVYDASSDAGADGAPSDASAPDVDAAQLADAGDATVSDAGADASDASSEADSWSADSSEAPDVAGETTLSILAAAGAGCLACAEASQTIEATGTCEDLVGSVATQGSAVGASRVSLCLEVLSCVLGHACTDIDAGDDLACYCGTNCGGTSAPNGACMAQELNGSEQSSPADVEDLTNYYDQAVGAGRANLLVGTLAFAGCGSCFSNEQ